jgi:ubiquinone/menaquinone biosynthesis C-methylase UbiE
MKHCKERLPAFRSYVDLGCGSQPENAILFSKHFSDVFCLDIFRPNIECARARMRRDRHHFAFFVADAQNLPFKDRSFDCASAFSLIEHLPDQYLFIKEVNRILKKRGLLVMQFPNGCFFIDPHTSLLFPQIVHNILAFCFPKLSAILPHNLTRKKALALCNSFLRIMDVEKVNYPEKIVSSKMPMRLIYRLLEKSGSLNICPFGFLFVCIKP